MKPGRAATHSFQSQMQIEATFSSSSFSRFGESQSESDSDDDNEEIEEDESVDEMNEIIRDLYPELNRNFENNTTTVDEDFEGEPNDEAKSFYRFRIEDRDKSLKIQNCGVVVVGDTGAETEKRDYYGLLTKVIELQYVGGCPPKSRNGNDSTFRGDKLMFIPPGALGKGRAQIDLRSFYSLRPSTSQSESILSLWKKRILEKNQGKLKRNVRGKNKCKEVAKLKSGKKLGVKFYNKRVVGKNHRVSFEAIAIFVHFVCTHGRRLEMKKRNICGLRTMQETLRNIPEDIDREDWEWLVKEHFSSKSFWYAIAASKHNSSNRAKLTMPHRTGGNLVGEDTIKQYEKIVTATQSGPSSSNIELVEECFGPQRHNHIICHGDGLKPNDLKTIGTRAELQAKLHETQKENDSLKSRMDERKPK
uniref:Uncharacterized protein n=1 Tax=Ananas comosus var. bracteatus TaxID=296719 RepID=A0A6V7NXD7_ANACO|nr:unnamed protein product [Ananas comosus var. bracteatus]